jgi:ribokinase
MPPGARLAVVGHTEWVTFARVERLPRPGEIVHATATWEDPGGGGGIVAVLLAATAGDCAFFTAVGADDGLGEALAARRVRVHSAPHPASRRIFTHLDADGERTITVLGERLDPRGADELPWAELASADGVFVTAGDGAAVRAARATRLLVATPRAGDGLTGVDIDALVWSAHDPDEAAAAERFSAAARLRVETRGADGGSWTAADGSSGAWEATPLPGAPVDAFGCGDAFAAALTAALAAGERLDAALDRAARAGAATLCHRGPYGAIES